MSNNALIVYEQFDNLQRAAKALYASKFFNDAKSEAQAIVKVMAGAELGIPPFAAMTGIHIIQGKPAIGSNVIATLVKNDPRYDYRVKVATDKECVLTWYESGEAVGESTFTWSEAQSVKQWNSKKNSWEPLSEKHNYRNYPSDMLFARALTRGARRFAPGIFGGSPVYTADELGADTDEEGNIVEGVTEVVQPEEVRLTGRDDYEQHISPGDSPKKKPKKPAPKNGKGDHDALGRIHKFGTILYGDKWDDRRHEIVSDITNGRTESSKELTEEEKQGLLSDLVEAVNVKMEQDKD